VQKFLPTHSFIRVSQLSTPSAISHPRQIILKRLDVFFLIDFCFTNKTVVVNISLCFLEILAIGCAKLTKTIQRTRGGAFARVIGYYSATQN